MKSRNGWYNLRGQALRKQVLVLFSVALTAGVWAQHKPLRMHTTFGNVRFEYDTLIVSPQQVRQLLLQEPEAYKQFRKARVNSFISSTLGTAGGALLAYAVVSSILNREVDVNHALAGGLLVVASLPFERGYRARASHAIELYNQNASARCQPRLFWRGTAVGVMARF